MKKQTVPAIKKNAAIQQAKPNKDWAKNIRPGSLRGDRDGQK